MSADSPSPLSPWSNTTMKFNMAITSAVIAAASTMAHANASVNIVSSKASIDAKNSAKALLDKHDLSYLVDSNINGLAVAMRLDDKPLKIDVRTLVAAMDGADSTTQNIYNPNLVMGCYSNCYSNCHGSRSWR